MGKLRVSPVPHLAGPLSLELSIDEGRIVDARVAGLTHRRLEGLARGYHVRDLPQIARRICSSCGTAHEIAAAQAVEQFAQIQVSEYTRTCRNIVLAIEVIASHIKHFYHVSLSDFYALSKVRDYEGSDPALQKIRNQVIDLDRTQDTAPFFLKSEIDQFLIYDAAVVATAWLHWEESFQTLRTLNRCTAVFLGRSPGGVGNSAGSILKRVRLMELDRLREQIIEVKRFIDRVYLEDMLIVASGPLKILHQQKIGYGVGNFLTFGMYDLRMTGKTKFPKRVFPAGALFASNLKEVHPIDLKKIKEELKYAWFQSDSEFPETDFNKSQGYSYIKAARYQGSPMETGPLSRLMVKNDKEFAALLKIVGSWPSFLTRTLARGFEAKKNIESILNWLDDLSDIEKTDLEFPPEEASGTGIGLIDGPDGAILSRISVQQGRVSSWNVIDGSTWNGSPRDNSMLKGPAEQALIGAPAEGPQDLLNCYRVIHSFNICGLCGAH